MSPVDRDGLENASCECYCIIPTEFDRLLPQGARGDGGAMSSEIADVAIEEDEATVEVEGPSGRQSIAVPAEVARALYDRRP